MHIMSGVMNPLQTLFGRHEQPIGVEAHADVAVVRRGVSARVHAPADFDDVGAELRTRCSCACVRPGTCRGTPSEQKNSCVRDHPRATARCRARRTCRTPDRAPSAHPAPDAAAPRSGRRAPTAPRRCRRHAPERARDEHEQDEQQDEAQHHAPGSAPPPIPGMRRLQAVERPLRRLSFRAVGRDLQHLLPRLCRAVEILLAERLDDADVEQRLRVLRIELAANDRTAPAPCRADSCSSTPRPRSVLTFTSFGLSPSASVLPALASSCAGVKVRFPDNPSASSRRVVPSRSAPAFKRFHWRLVQDGGARGAAGGRERAAACDGRPRRR